MRPTTAAMLTALALVVSAPGAADAGPLIRQTSGDGDAQRWLDRLDAERAKALGRLSPARAVVAGADVEAPVVAAARLAGEAASILPYTSMPPRLSLPSGLAATVAGLEGAVAAAASVARPGAPRAALAGALRTVARAVDDALPSLRVLAPTAAGRSSGCDLADQSPALCVGGTGPNTISGDYALVVDLGGDDVHLHAAGGADAVGNGLPVSVTIDVNGNDRYETAVPSADGARAVQGAAFGGGVGVLVDAAGRDVYRATSEAAGASALGQGLGSAGAGLLADLGGDDDYALEERTPGVVTSTTQRMPAAGQGWGELGGLGILLDTAGDDVALVRSSPPGAPTPFVRHAGGFGGGEQAGVGLHADLGGTDRFTLEALDGTSATSYGASARGFGFGFQGVGVEVGGLGDTERIARVRNDVVEQPADSAAMFAIGTASQAGFGALHDAGGNDRYVSEFASISRSESTVADGCACQGAGATAQAGGGQTLSIGAGQAGTGVLEDLQGNDRYETSSVTLAHAVARDDRTLVEDFVPTTAEATTFVAGGSFAPPSSQMVTQGTGIAGTGLLLDGAGNDAYDVDLRVESIAETVGPARVPTSPDESQTTGPLARALGGELDVYMQGIGQVGGVGAIEDGAGDDRYDLSLTMRMDADVEDRRGAGSSTGYPVTADARMSNGYHDIYGQGIGVVGGAGFLHDGLGDDVYTIDHTLEARANTTAVRNDVPREANARTGLFARVEAMGAGGLGGYGELRDHGGTDRYACVARSTALAVPETALEDGNGQCQVLGGGTAFGYFEDLEGGSADAIVIEPPFPATVGTRGQGVWAGPGGAGINA